MKIWTLSKNVAKTMKKNRILLINPSKDFYKKDVDHALSIKFLNFGLLSIASLFPENIIIYDCQGKDNDILICEILEIIDNDDICMVGISLISAYSEKCAFKIADKIHNKFPNIPIIYGGKDHAQYIAKDLLYNHHASAVIKGYGEYFFQDLIKNKYDLFSCSSVIYKNSENKIVANAEKSFPLLIEYNHELYPNFTEFVPSIEISRGCNKHCLFCSNNSMKKQTKDIHSIVREIDALKKLYGENVCIYFQTPHFLISKKDLITLSELRTVNDKFIWRTQTSVRYLTPERIRLLYAAGARVIDVGFESGSPTILEYMKKDINPKKYISIMSEALEYAYQVGLRIKLNILLFAGETRETLTQTIEFLKANLYNFHSFSAYPVMLYPGPNSHLFKEKIENEFTGSVEEVNMSKNIFHVNLSKNLDWKKATEIALLLGKSLQTEGMYMSQRRIGYIPTSQMKNVASFDQNVMPFFRSSDEQKLATSKLQKIIGELE